MLAERAMSKTTSVLGLCFLCCSGALAEIFPKQPSFGVLFAVESVSLNLCLSTFKNRALKFIPDQLPRTWHGFPTSPLITLYTSTAPDSSLCCFSLGQAGELSGSRARRTATIVHGSSVELHFHEKWKKKWDRRCSRNKALRSGSISSKCLRLLFNYQNQPNKQTTPHTHTKKPVNSHLIKKQAAKSKEFGNTE